MPTSTIKIKFDSFHWKKNEIVFKLKSFFQCFTNGIGVILRFFTLTQISLNRFTFVRLQKKKENIMCMYICMKRYNMIWLIRISQVFLLHIIRNGNLCINVCCYGSCFYYSVSPLDFFLPSDFVFPTSS